MDNVRCNTGKSVISVKVDRSFGNKKIRFLGRGLSDSETG